MLGILILISGLLSLVSSQTTPVNKCIYHKGPLPIKTHIENCVNPPCKLPQLQDVVIHIKFKAPHDLKSMKTLATAYFFGPIGVPYGLGDSSVTCSFLDNGHCPVKQDEVVTYTLRMYIQPYFPVGTSVTIEFRIVDDKSKPVMCIRVPVAIVPALSSDGTARRAGNDTVPNNGNV